MNQKENILLKALILCVIYIGVNQNLSAQNLITNPGFEQFRSCPKSYNITLATGYEVAFRWYTVSEASPDYFNACSRSDQVGVPKNFAGTMKPRSGNGYIGLILKSDQKYYHGSPNYTEHIQNRMSSSLKKDRYYCFEIWMCLGKNSTIATKDFGVYFSKQKITFPNPPDTLPKPHIQYKGDEFFTESGRWVPIRGVYKASGGEKYITIGNFEPWEKMRIMRLKSHFEEQDLKEFAYYLFDDASLVMVKDPSQCKCNMITVEPVPETPDPEEMVVEQKDEFEQVEVGESFILKNIFFEFDKSTLLPESYPELDKLVELMDKYPAMTIEIGGHTDDRGSVEYNIRLSRDRANSVVNYLISQGIASERLTWYGYGKSKPVAENTTDEGRQTNRRVEFKVLTK